MIQTKFFLIILILTLTNKNISIVLFLFAHQDDEFGVFHQIERELKTGRRVICAYATDGAATADPHTRDAESRKVLKKLGVSSQDIFFIGRDLHIGDGQLHKHCKAFSNWMSNLIKFHTSFEACYIPAWEGGHPDHDLLHAITVDLFGRRNWLSRVRQYSLYNGRNCRGPFFRVMSPLPENGPVEKFSISWGRRIWYIFLCLSYPSQWRSWVGLFPLAFFYYLFVGEQQLQRVDEMRLNRPPHSGMLYYETRNFASWLDILNVINGFNTH